MSVDKDTVIAALKRIKDPDEGRDVVALGYVNGLVIQDGQVGFSLDVGDAETAEGKEPLRRACQEAVSALDGVTEATVVLTGERPPEGGASAPHNEASSQGQHTAGRGAPGKGQGLTGVGAIIAVASGKGGVGKSTVAANLAIALGKRGLRVGLMDADIYGPSIPMLLGLSGRPKVVDGMVQPMEAHGVKAMSIGLLVDNSKAMIWRGPMVAGALTQLLNDTEWGELDILVVDLPPGTGDAQLTMAQRVPLAGAVIVSTPQDIALIDARKGIAMFEKVNVPVLGLIENMSVFVCPECGAQSHIFGTGGAQRTAEEIGATFLGAIPLTTQLRETSDAGKPIVASNPNSPEAEAFNKIATSVAQQAERMGKPAPSIAMET